MGGPVDPMYHTAAVEVIDRSTCKKISVRHRSSVKLQFNVAVPESTLRWALF